MPKSWKSTVIQEHATLSHMTILSDKRPGYGL